MNGNLNTLLRRRLKRLCALCAGLCLITSIAKSAEPLLRLEEQAIKTAAALAEPSIVRIETVGGLDLVGELIAGTGPTSGVVVSPDGYIITSSFNFASKPASIIVTLPDGRRHAAELVASDRARMLSLLKIDASAGPTPLTPLVAVPRDGVRVGDWAIALGRVYDPALPNISSGIISAVNRVWGRAVQTDAKVSPVNYGGALVDIEGRGIGILVPLSPQKTDETAGVEWYDGGIGFAVPLEDVYAVLDRLKTGQDLHPGLLGVTFPDMSALAGEARVDRVRPESPADQAGIRIDDVIVGVDSQPVERIPDLRHLLGRRYADDVVKLSLRRGEERLDVRVTLAAELVPFESGYLGVLPVRPPQEAGAASGVELREVLPDSPATEAGLQRRDVLTACDGQPVADAAALVDLVSRRHPGDEIQISYRRDGQDGTATVKIGKISAHDEDPLDFAASNIPAPEAGVVPESALGRANGTLPQGGAYWRYVPEQYNPAYKYGLVVWLHPAGDTMEAAMMRLWKQHCDRRGLILVAPKAADLSGWTPGEAEIVRQVVEQMQKEYSIDPARICLHGHAEGGRFAWSAAFKYRDLFRAVCTTSAPLREPPPDNDPDLRTQTCLAAGAADALRPKIEKSAKVLREMKFPTRLIVIPKLGEEYPAEATVEELSQWIDALDRIDRPCNDDSTALETA